MSIFLTVVDGQTSFPLAFTAVYVVGFIAAVGVGSLAWYNSKRPAGWEDNTRPDFMPEIDTEKKETES